MKYIGIDPSSNTGLVRLDEAGRIEVQLVITGIGTTDPRRIATLVDTVMSYIAEGDHVAIEGFSFNSTGRGVDFQYGLGYMIRDRLYRRKVPYVDVAPTALKSFAGANTHYGEKGSKKRFKGDAIKREMARACYEKWGYENANNNITDAYALARYSLEHKDQVKPEPKPKTQSKRSKTK